MSLPKSLCIYMPSFCPYDLRFRPKNNFWHFCLTRPQEMVCPVSLHFLESKMIIVSFIGYNPLVGEWIGINLHAYIYTLVFLA